MLHRAIFSAFVLSHSFLLAPNKGDEVPSAGGAGTLKDQISQAQAELKAANEKAEASRLKLEADLKAANEKAEASEAAKLKLEADLKAANEKGTKLEADNSKLSAEVTKLTGEAKTADDRAKEQAAAHGIKPLASGAAAAGAVQDGATLYAEYSKLKGREKSAFLKANEKPLMAYAKEMEKQAAGV